MRIVVVGAGPVGRVLSAMLLRAGHELLVVEIDPRTRGELQEHGIRVTGSREIAVAVPRVVAGLEEMDTEAVDVVFVAVKAPATPLVAAAVEDHVSGRATVVSWQNGIDTERALAQSMRADRVVRAVINHGATRRDDGSVEMSFEHPPHLVRELSPDGADRARAVADLLTDAGLSTERAEDLAAAVWRKASLNAALNAICALTGQNMQDAWTDRYAGDLARRVLRESVLVARANEILLGSDFYRYALDYLDRGGRHRPSMLLDREAGRRSEIDFINGKIVEYGAMAGVATPFNEALVALVKAAERAARARTE